MFYHQFSNRFLFNLESIVIQRNIIFIRFVINNDKVSILNVL